MHVTEYENTVNIIDARFCLLIFCCCFDGNFILIFKTVNTVLKCVR